MSNNFRIFSTEQGASIDPDSLDPAPTTLIEFGEDPDASNYNPVSEASDRGTVFATLGGNTFQDFGVVESDGVIIFSDTASLSQTVVTALKTAYETVDGEFYFTDGYNCWKVRFSRNPKGLKCWRDIFYAAKGKTYFSYSIQLLVVSEEI